MSIFAERLRELRGQESQASFADTIGINKIQYAKYEGGKNSPSIDVLFKICRAHAVSSDWLLGLKDSCSARQNNSARAGAGGIAINVSNNKIGGAVGPIAIKGTQPPNCRTCPHLKKLNALEKVLNKGYK